MIQASLIAEEVLREDADVVRVLFNKFHSAISFKPTMATVLSAEVRQEIVGKARGSKDKAGCVCEGRAECVGGRGEQGRQTGVGENSCAISFKPTMATVLSAEVRQGEGATKMFVCVWGGGVARRPPPMQPDRASCQLDTC
jgi:F0F1-type ATP synthase gamma subunit